MKKLQISEKQASDKRSKKNLKFVVVWFGFWLLRTSEFGFWFGLKNVLEVKAQSVVSAILHNFSKSFQKSFSVSDNFFKLSHFFTNNYV